MATLYEVTVYLKCSDLHTADAMSRGLKKICDDVQKKLPGAIVDATITLNKLEVME